MMDNPMTKEAWSARLDERNEYLRMERALALLKEFLMGEGYCSQIPELAKKAMEIVLLMEKLSKTEHSPREMVNLRWIIIGLLSDDPKVVQVAKDDWAELNKPRSQEAS